MQPVPTSEQRGVAAAERRRHQRGRWRTHRACLLPIALALAWVGFAAGQPLPPPSPVATTPPPTAVPAPEIPARAEGDAKRVIEITLAFESPRELAKVQRNLPRLAEESDILLHDPRLQPDASLTRLDLADLRRRWLLASGELTQWTGLLGRRGSEIDANLAELKRLEETWALTARTAAAADVPATLRERVRALRADIERATGALRERLDAILALQGTLAQRSAMVAEQLRFLESAEAKLRSGLFERDTTPLWTVAGDLPHALPLAHVFSTAWRAARRDLVDYLRDQPARIACHLLASLVFLLVLLGIRRRAATWPLRTGLEQLVRTSTQPVSSALVVAVLLAIPLYWNTAPRIVGTLLGLVATVPALRLLQVGRYVGLPMAPVAVLIALDATRTLLPPFSAFARTYLLVEHLLVVALLGWNFRHARVTQLPVTERWRRVLAIGGRTALGALALAGVANVLGNVSLAQLLTDSTLRSIYLALVAGAGAQVLALLLAAALCSRLGQSIRTVRRHGSTLQEQGAMAIRVAMTLLWFVGTLRVFVILDQVTSALATALNARLSVGALSISLGDVLALVITIAVSFLLARIVRFVLEENVLPRFALARGIPRAISVGASYTVLLIGFFAALSAAGLDFGRLTVLLGAFGVGLSFGLQNIVNNFVSGLILIFERPIQVGDTIEIEQAFGDVRRIGIRSTTLRTFDGAEVIIPNGTLLDQKLINWTLSDRERRIEVKVGVAYGTDPRQVLDLLRTVADQHPDVLTQPAPSALFEGFGDSSLNFALRAWTARTDAFLQVRSDLTVMTYGALQEAGIEIPFPQRDLHLRSIAAAPPEGRALETTAEPDTPQNDE